MLVKCYIFLQLAVYMDDLRFQTPSDRELICFLGGLVSTCQCMLNKFNLTLVISIAMTESLLESLLKKGRRVPNMTVSVD